ncbi:hypothetical protein MPDQ_004972 [Monascus purpureus]|uniref:Major facilitator superfamily (MFS) profile domain-containing protein n=1 Tax=Monascus purpureus TaxID=5098 RepID=A0A507R0M6_MONPU|nr:hypothetical protein MPDQ_004972 [Monascus purpureus]
MAGKQYTVVAAVGVDTASDSPSMSPVAQKAKTTAKTPWWAHLWGHDPTRSAEEVRFIRKLDVFLVSILCLGYFIKNLDQANISNAYVSGMKEDLQMSGNQLNLIDTAWTVGYVLGQVPSQVILTHLRPSVWVPACELIWSMLTFCLAAAKTSNHVITVRFFIGLFESAFYPAAHTILGAWYKPSELGKRACVFHASAAGAGMFSGYLQAGVYKGLNGARGLPGWKWLLAYHGWPRQHTHCFGWAAPVARQSGQLESILSHQRGLRACNTAYDFRRPCPANETRQAKNQVYLLTVLYVIFVNHSPSASLNPLALWMKSTGRYSVYQINIYPTGQKAIPLISTAILAIISDRFRTRPAIMSISTVFAFLSSLLLAVWAIPDALKWFAFYISPIAIPYGPLAMSWASEICAADAEERAITIGIMNSVAYAFNAWLPLVVFPATQAPRFKRGWVYSTIMAFPVQAGITWVVWYFWRREERQKEKERGAAVVEEYRDP